MRHFQARHAQAVGRAAVAAGVGFVIRGQRIADAGDQKARRRLADDGGVDQHQVRIARQEFVVGDAAVFVVHHRQRAAGRVRRGDGRHDDHRQRQAMRGRLGRVERLAAADADDHAGAGFAGQFDDAGDLGIRTFAAMAHQFGRCLAVKRGQHLVLQDVEYATVQQHHGLLRKRRHFAAQHRQRARALQITAREARAFYIVRHEISLSR